VCGLGSLAAPGFAFASELTISNLSPDSYFSPNGDGQEDTATVSYDLSGPASVSIVIRNSKSKIVRAVQSSVAESEGYNSFSWNGREEGGTPAPNGVYTYTISAENAAKETATANGRIGVERGLPGTVAKPTPESAITGTTNFVFTPATGADVTAVTFYGRCPYYPYTCSLGTALGPEASGTFVVSSEVKGLSSGANEITAYVYFTDAFGQEHVYAVQPVPVTVAYPEEISSLSPNRYFYPNGSGEEETASVGYGLSTAAKVTVVLRNSSNKLVKTLLTEVEQGPGGGSFTWDGTEEGGGPAPNGAYTYSITAAGAYGPPATDSGEIGLDRNLPGHVTKPKSGATITGTESFVFTPTSGEDVTETSFYGRCPYYPGTCFLGDSFTPEANGTFVVSSEVETLTSGANEILTYVDFTDPFGQEHSYSAPTLPVTVAYPEKISELSPDRYFYPNGSGQEETASVDYSLSTAAKVTVVLRNSSKKAVKTLLKEVEQGPGGGDFTWDGTEEGGKAVPAGVYTYTITAEGADGPPATATGRIGLDRNLPGTVTEPTSDATLTDSGTFIFTPTSGETVTSAYFYAHCSYYPYTCFVGSSSTPEPNGTFVFAGTVENLAAGANEIFTYVSFTDPFGQEHSYSAPAVPVTIDYPSRSPRYRRTAICTPASVKKVRM